MQAEFDKELQSYFTDVEYLLNLFKQWLAEPTLPKRLLVIHGVGGIGKSSLLRMFRLYCKSVRAFARGLPMVVTSAVQLWVRYGVEDFQAVKPKVVENLVDRLMEGVPKELAPALEAAAIVRWFDQPILRAVMKQECARGVQ